MIILPTHVYLTAKAERWKIAYDHAPGDLSLVELPCHNLIIQGERHTKREVTKILIKWIKLKAESYLTEFFYAINRRVKADCKKLKIRSSNLEWGYCSPDREISLNYKLIFLPKTLVRHLIIHELCHVRHLNHSPHFWREVKKYDKSCTKNNMRLYEGNHYLPKWIIY